MSHFTPDMIGEIVEIETTYTTKYIQRPGAPMEDTREVSRVVGPLTAYFEGPDGESYAIAGQDFRSLRRGSNASVKVTTHRRTALRDAIANVLVNSSNYPEAVQVHLLGRDLSPLIEKVVEAASTRSTK